MVKTNARAVIGPDTWLAQQQLHVRVLPSDVLHGIIELSELCIESAERMEHVVPSAVCPGVERKALERSPVFVLQSFLLLLHALIWFSLFKKTGSERVYSMPVDRCVICSLRSKLRKSFCQASAQQVKSVRLIERCYWRCFTAAAELCLSAVLR